MTHTTDYLCAQRAHVYRQIIRSGSNAVMCVKCVDLYQHPVVGTIIFACFILMSVFYIDCTSEIACEQQVDSYLNSYCTSAIPATVTQGPTTTITSTQVQAQTTVTRVQATTVTETSISTVTVSSSQSGQTTVSVGTMVPSSQTSSSNVQRVELALAALFGLAIIVLMAVIAGWVLTYSIMKKRARENNGSIQHG